MRTLTTIGAALLLTTPTSAKTHHPQQAKQLTCLDFHLPPDRAWRAYHPLVLGDKKARVRLDPNVPLRRGELILGVDLASMLDEKCR